MKPLSSETTQELTGKLVSVIMPAFNVEAYLRCAVNSVLNQTYQPHEILFIDDGSTDDTARVAQEFGDCIRYIYQKNAGVSAARNRGIQEVSGDFIAFLDADDEWLPNHLERAMKVFKRYPFLKWFAAAHEERSHEMEVVKPKISQKVKDMLGTKEYFDDYFHANNIGKVFWTGTFVMRKSVFDKVGIFDKNLRRGGDLDMWFRIALRYPEIGYSTQIGAVYWRWYSTITTKSFLTLKERLNFCEKQAYMASKYGSKAAERYDSRMRQIIKRLYIEGIKTADRNFVNQISNKYGRYIPYRWQLLNRFMNIIPLILFRLLLKTLKILLLIWRKISTGVINTDRINIKQN